MDAEKALNAVDASGETDAQPAAASTARASTQRTRQGERDPARVMSLPPSRHRVRAAELDHAAITPAAP
jgi:hypothetical protein